MNVRAHLAYMATVLTTSTTLFVSVHLDTKGYIVTNVSISKNSSSDHTIYISFKLTPCCCSSCLPFFQSLCWFSPGILVKG